MGPCRFRQYRRRRNKFEWRLHLHADAKCRQNADLDPVSFTSPAAIKATNCKLEKLVRGVVFGAPCANSKQSRCLVGRKQLSQSEIVRAAMDSVDQRESECISVIDLATAAGVSERTLRKAFLSYFGVAPVKFLKYRTLNQVRKVLQNSDSSLTTVTQVATEHGIWELGRFATDYRLLFDELPSETLRHGRNIPHKSDASSSMRFVA